MENVILVVHLLLALGLIGVVLLQRSEGGGLGMGGGGGGVGVMSSRAAATALGKVTWFLAIGFIITSIALTISAASKSSGSSVIDQIGGSAPAATAPSDLTDGLLPPVGEDAGPLVPNAN